MTLTDLETQYPGLFEQTGCRTPSEAERHADKVAANAGLVIRAGSWTSSGGNRHIEYRNFKSTLRLLVEIYHDDSGRSSQPSFLFSFSAERVDANLSAHSQHAVRVKPSSFARDAKDLVAALRALTVTDGRVTGRLRKWNAAKGVGVLECLPGALVKLEASDLPSGSKKTYNQWFSFAVEKSASGQKAVNVRRCSGH